MEEFQTEKPQDQHNLLFEQNPVPMWVYDSDTYMVLAVNSAAIDYFGFSKEDYLKKSIFDLIHNDDLPVLVKILEESKGADNRRGLFKLLKKSGSIAYVEIVSAKIEYMDRPAWICTSLAIEKKGELEKKLQFQRKITRTLAAGKSVSEAGAKILELMCNEERWVIGELWLQDISKQDLKLEATYYRPGLDIEEYAAFSKRMRPAKGRRVIGKVWAEGKILVITNINDAYFLRYDFLVDLNINCVVVLPVTGNNETIGVLAFYSKEYYELSESMKLVYESYSKQIGDFCEKCQERQLMELRDLRIMGILDSAISGIISINQDQKIVLFNRSAENTFMYKVSDVIGKSINILIPERYRAGHPKHIIEFSKSGLASKSLNFAGNIYGLRSNGEEFPMDAAISQIKVGNEKFFTIILRDNSERVKAEALIAASLKEKEILLKEIHHRVKNNLQIISSLLSLQANYIQDEKIISIFEESRNRIKAMALIHEKLYSTDMLSNINFKEYVNELMTYLKDTYEYNHDYKIDLKINIEELNISLDMIVVLGLILNELISNSLKYAFKGRKSGCISILFRKENKGYIMIFADDGIGLPFIPKPNETNTLGMQLIFNLTEQLNGHINFNIENGTKVTMYFQPVK